jgi:hypothetical protein
MGVDGQARAGDGGQEGGEVAAPESDEDEVDADGKVDYQKDSKYSEVCLVACVCVRVFVSVAPAC